jgi:hypothetical protein
MVNADAHYVVGQVSCYMSRGMLQMCMQHGTARVLPDTCKFHDLRTEWTAEVLWCRRLAKMKAL